MSVDVFARVDLSALEAALNATLPPEVREAAAEPDRPVLGPARLEADPTLEEAIKEVVAEHLLGKGKAQDEKRAALVKALGEKLATLPVFGIDLDDARVAIGEEIDLGNAVIQVDGFGRAVTITVDAGTPIWYALVTRT